MCYEGGIREFAIWCNRNKTPLCEDVIYMSGSKGDASAEIAVQYNDGYNEFLLSFANDVRTPEGGMHETGFKTALTRVLNAYGVKNGIIKATTRFPARIAGRHHRHYFRQAHRRPVRGSDQSQAGQRLYPYSGRSGGERPADHLF